MNVLKLAVSRTLSEVTLRRCTTQSLLLNGERRLLGTKIRMKNSLNGNLIIILTRMHSTGMRSARLLTVSRSIPWGGGLPNPLDAEPPWMQTPLEADHPFNADTIPQETDPLEADPPVM